jgi:serine protease inhibitor
MDSPQRIRPVAAVNRMTTQWLRARSHASDAESSLFCAPAAWPLLALLTDAADGQARDELEHALGLPASDSRTAALETLNILRGMSAVRSALGIWLNERFPLNEAWKSGLTLGTLGLLTGDPDIDAPMLDAWAQQHTDHLIDAMPVHPTPETALLLATAMTVRTRWVRPFEDWNFPLECEAGPWQGRRIYPLRRVSRVLDRVNVVPTDFGDVTCLELLGQEGISVHLVMGEEGGSAGEVLQGGLQARARKRRGRRGGDLPVGTTAPGLIVERVPDDEPDDRLLILVPKFRISATQDLLRLPDVFGLKTATDTSRGRFPAISSEPLAVSQAIQSAVADFTAEGFEAAAVTAAGVVAGGGGHPQIAQRRVKQVRVEFDRPFGFLVTHRTTDLILAAGWVAEPGPYAATDEDSEVTEWFRAQGIDL